MTDRLRYTLIDGVKCFSPEVAQSYSDYPDGGFDITDESANASFWVRSRNRLFKRIVLEQMNRGGRTRLLEIGCGTGEFIRHIVDTDGMDITGSEVYLKGLVYAKRKLPDVEFIQLDVTQGTIDTQFDMIVAFDVIEHIDDDIAALANMHQMLTPGGTLVISVPQHQFLWSRLDDIVRHKRRYSSKELQQKLQAQGFIVNRRTSFVFVLFPLMLVSRLLDKRGGHSDTDNAALDKRVTFSPWLNTALDGLMRIDEALIRLGLSLPFGGTLLAIARKNA